MQLPLHREVVHRQEAAAVPVVVAFVSQKGGVGKSTLTRRLGYRCEPQRSQNEDRRSGHATENRDRIGNTRTEGTTSSPRWRCSRWRVSRRRSSKPARAICLSSTPPAKSPTRPTTWRGRYTSWSSPPAQALMICTSPYWCSWCEAAPGLNADRLRNRLRLLVSEGSIGRATAKATSATAPHRQN